jgi:hypothetical protein
VDFLSLIEDVTVTASEDVALAADVVALTVAVDVAVDVTMIRRLPS